MKLTFNDLENVKELTLLDTIIDFIFMFDILLTFNTAVYSKGVRVYDRKIIVLFNFL